MPFFTDVRTGSSNNVIEINNKLLIEGQEYQLPDLAPVALRRGPTSFPTGLPYNVTVLSGVQGCSQLCLPKTYVRGLTGVLPSQTQAGEFDTEKIMCGQQCSVGWVFSSGQQRYYGVAGYYSATGTNAIGKVTAFDADFRIVSPGIATVGTVVPYVAGASYAYPGVVFLPSSNLRWFTIQAQSQFLASTNGMGTTSIQGAHLGMLTETGVFSTIRSAFYKYPVVPYYDSQWVIVLGVGWYLSQANDTYSGVSAYAYTRALGVETILNASWLSQANVPAASSTLCYPSQAIVETPGSQIYFYQPTMSASALTVYIGTVSGLSTAAPSISAWNAVGATLTMDTSQVSFPAVPTSTYRRVRAWVMEDGADKYLCIAVYEPGTTNTVPTAAINLYLWQLQSKTVATFMQKVELGAFGRVRSIMSLDSTRKRIAVVYDTGIVYYAWNSSSWWVFQSRQDVNTQDVGVDSQGRLWATDNLGTYIPDVPSGTFGQSLYVFEPSGAAVSMTVEFEESSYTFSGTTINSRIVVNAYDTTGTRIAVDVVLTRNSTNFQFTGGASSDTVTTLTSGNAFVDVQVISTGLLSCRAATA